jgi:hypothetical protein
MLISGQIIGNSLFSSAPRLNIFSFSFSKIISSKFNKNLNMIHFSSGPNFRLCEKIKL